MTDSRPIQKEECKNRSHKGARDFQILFERNFKIVAQNPTSGPSQLQPCQQCSSQAHIGSVFVNPSSRVSDAREATWTLGGKSCASCGRMRFSIILTVALMLQNFLAKNTSNVRRVKVMLPYP